MEKKSFVLALMLCLAIASQAQVAKYCMSYSDFVSGNWKSVDDLTQGRTKQACQMKSGDNYYYFRTGDKDADQVLKKDAFAVMYGDHMYVNCRNLRNNDCPLDVSSYTQAVRFDKNKICVLAYKTDDASLLLGAGLLIGGLVVDNPVVSLGMDVAGTGCWIGNDFLSKTNCYLVDSNATGKGTYNVTRMNDKYMEQLLSHDARLLEKYNAIHNKRDRQSSANVLPILMEKGLIASNAIR